MITSDWLLGVDGPIAMTILEYALSEMVIRLARIAFPVIKTNTRLNNQFIFVCISTRRFELNRKRTVPQYSYILFIKTLCLISSSYRGAYYLISTNKFAALLIKSKLYSIKLIRLHHHVRVHTFFLCLPFFVQIYCFTLYNKVARKCWSDSVGVLSQVHVRQNKK